MIKYVEIKNVFRVLEGNDDQYIVFIADNALIVDIQSPLDTSIRLNSNVTVKMATIFFNEAMSFVPCFQYVDGEDVVVFSSPNFIPHIDSGGQFSTEYYGMRHELMENIESTVAYMDLNDDHRFKECRLAELVTESKTIFYFPDYLLQVTSRAQLINLLDLAIHLRNISFTILVLFYLERTSIRLVYKEREDRVIKISGPWKNAICYVFDQPGARSQHYDSIFRPQFTDLDQYKDAPLDEFIESLCEHFTRYQRFIEGGYQIIPTKKQKAFLKQLLCAEECFHFSEVGSGKTKVILPLLCQIFLSNNVEAHDNLRRGGKLKDTLVVLVPEHLVSDAKNQVYRYCLNLNFRANYKVYDDIHALKHETVQFVSSPLYRSMSRKVEKHIFVTSFNQLKKALTDESICRKVRPHRERILVIADEVDDFLDRNKLVFNICTNKNSSFEKSILDLFLTVCRSAYYGDGSGPPSVVNDSLNPTYWDELHGKFCAIYEEIQGASRSINKSFGIFNPESLRHCTSNIIHDIEGYKCLIARPYESVNRAMPGSYYSDVERTIFLTFVILSEDIGKYDDLFQAERKFITYDYWSEHFLHLIEFDDLVYGHDKLSEICTIHHGIKDGLIGFLFEIILRRMEIRDRSRSCNSIDVIFNFDTIGFTGTPFIDNYPTADYIRHNRRDQIPNMIDRTFYAYEAENLSEDDFQDRFELFQGQNSHVMARYVSSDFISSMSDEMDILEAIFVEEEKSQLDDALQDVPCFNAVVDLCGIFKRSTIKDVCEAIKGHFGPDRFNYIYHIDQEDNSDRVLCMKTGNDIQYDEEFYKNLHQLYGSSLRDKIFFFVDNRNVIGKDIPFQLIYKKQFGGSMFRKSVVIAHDVDDFSKIWQAMGRSRTMNNTVFSIYMSGILPSFLHDASEAKDIKSLELTKILYTTNCDRKIAGNISSIYLTLIALFNLANGTFYYNDQIVNVFLDKMESNIRQKVSNHQNELIESVLGQSVPCGILQHILIAKLRKSSSADVSQEAETLSNDSEKLQLLLRHLVAQKYEQRNLSSDIFDQLVLFLSGEQKSLMEISYTKQHQKQKQKQQNKNQDSDTMGVFDKKHQFAIDIKVSDYFSASRNARTDKVKKYLNIPFPIPILSIACRLDGGGDSFINVYPTLQFLYSHFIEPAYITEKVKNYFAEKCKLSSEEQMASFLKAIDKQKNVRAHAEAETSMGSPEPTASLRVRVQWNHVRQNPQYSIAALQPGAYIIGMKDQLNAFDLASFHRLGEQIKYIMDDAGFILFDDTGSKGLEQFGPYFVEQYIVMEYLSRHEVAQNVLDHYCNNRETLEVGLKKYDEKQGKGFVCWRFLVNETSKAAARMAEDSNDSMDTGDEMEMEPSSSKKMRWDPSR